MNAPILSTPEQHGLHDPTVDRNPKQVRKWLDGLPLMNVGESLRQLINALEPLNEQRLDPAERLALLQLYREPVGKLFAASAPADLKRLPIGKAERQQAVDNLERLCLTLAGGFKIIVKELYRDARTNPQLFSAALDGALNQLARALIHSYRYYRAVPPFTFLELHQLYRLARQHGLALAGDGPPTETLAARYQAIMLLGLTDPFHLPEGAVDRLYRLLRQSAQLGRILPGGQWDGVPEGLFLLDLRGDSQPRLCVKLTQPVDADEPYLLDGRPIVEALHKFLLTRPAEHRAESIEALLLRALVPEVVTGEQRREKRRTEGRWLELFIGVDSIHAYLAERTNTAPVRRTAGDGAMRGGEVQSLRVLDASDSGMRLHWGGAGVGEMLVGELLGVLSDTDDLLPRLQLVVVRWVRCERDGSAELGVELVDGRPSAVNFRAVDSGDSDVVRCLFLPSSVASGGSAGLIAPVGTFGMDRRLLLYVGRREVPVRAARLVEATALWEQFEFAADGGA